MCLAHVYGAGLARPLIDVLENMFVDGLVMGKVKLARYWILFKFKHATKGDVQFLFGKAFGGCCTEKVAENSRFLRLLGIGEEVRVPIGELGQGDR